MLVKEKGLMEGEAFARAGEVVAEAVSSKESKSSTTKTSMSTQESVKVVNGVKTITRKTIVDGVVVSSTSETIPMQGGKGEAIQEEDEEDFDESDYDQLDQEEDEEDEAAKDEL